MRLNVCILIAVVVLTTLAPHAAHAQLVEPQAKRPVIRANIGAGLAFAKVALPPTGIIALEFPQLLKQYGVSPTVSLGRLWWQNDEDNLFVVGQPSTYQEDNHLTYATIGLSQSYVQGRRYGTFWGIEVGASVEDQSNGDPRFLPTGYIGGRMDLGKNVALMVRAAYMYVRVTETDVRTIGTAEPVTRETNHHVVPIVLGVSLRTN